MTKETNSKATYGRWQPTIIPDVYKWPETYGVRNFYARFDGTMWLISMDRVDAGKTKVIAKVKYLDFATVKIIEKYLSKVGVK